MMLNKLFNMVTLTTILLLIGLSTSQLPANNELDNSIRESRSNTEMSSDPGIFDQLQITMNELLYFITNKAIESFLKMYINKKKEGLAKEEPVTYDLQENISIAKGQIRLNASITGVTVANPSKFETKEIKSRVQNNSIDFKFYFPEIKTHNTTYSAEGKIHDYEVETSGEVKTETTHVIINGTVVYEFNNLKFKIKHLEIHYAFKKFKIEVTNLQIPFFSKAKLNELLSLYLSGYLKKEEPKISKELSKRIKEKINQKLKALSLFTVQESVYI